MLRRTSWCFPRGKPRSKNYDRQTFRIPDARLPHQGGQQHFNELQLQRRNATAAAERQSRSGGTGADGTAADTGGGLPRIAAPVAGLLDHRTALPADLAAAVDQQAMRDPFVSQRGYNELMDMEAGIRKPPVGESDGSVSTTDARPVATPEPVTSDREFQDKHGYSLLKKKSTFIAPAAPYSQLDLWAESTKLTANTYYLYLISRRRNVFAVMFDASGKRVLSVYTAGNRGLKNTDKGFQSEGSIDTSHTVTSQYLNDVLPVVYEREIEAGRMKPGEKKKVPVIVRVMGYYNGRIGAVRAVKDREDVLDVRGFEDITPPPPALGPKMPKNVSKHMHK